MRYICVCVCVSECVCEWGVWGDWCCSVFTVMRIIQLFVTDLYVIVCMFAVCILFVLCLQKKTSQKRDEGTVNYTRNTGGRDPH